ncbi:hypothetical protein M2283_009594 [Streptomyces pseudovenezuelae]|uniref:Secreted protein n=1 Tax=Streptomyces pseudovenezuelae TaxID=67350 RepID=A0ABT6M113_9ACTN|nr:hypothetical protein [Streptomyces pseudovenezuelae]
MARAVSMSRWVSISLRVHAAVRPSDNALSTPGISSGKRFAVVFGLLMGLVFSRTAVSERLQQRRLKRLGMWDGS